MLEVWEIMEQAEVDAWVACAVVELEAKMRYEGLRGFLIPGIALSCAKIIQQCYYESDVAHGGCNE